MPKVGYADRRDFMHTKTAFLFYSTLLIASIVWPASLSAADDDNSKAPEQKQDQVQIGRGYEIETDENVEHEYHPHHLGVFVGVTSLKERQGFTVGGEYEYRLHPHAGIGGLVEHATNDFSATTVAFPIFFHPKPSGDGLRLGVGPGFERAREPRSGEKSEHTATHFLVRATAIYDIFVKENVTVSPNLSIDFVNGEEIFIFGVTIGFGF